MSTAQVISANGASANKYTLNSRSPGHGKEEVPYSTIFKEKINKFCNYANTYLTLPFLVEVCANMQIPPDHAFPTIPIRPGDAPRTLRPMFIPYLNPIGKAPA